MKKRLCLGILACASIIALGLTGCKNTVDSAVTGIVSGYVVEAGTDGTAPNFIPVVGATVTMGQYSTTTDDNGVWSISDVIPTGNGETGYTVIVTKEGYVAAKLIDALVVNASEYVNADVDSKIAIATKLAESGDALETVTTTSTSASGVTSLYADSEILDALPSVEDIAYTYSISVAGVSLTPTNCTASGTLLILGADGTTFANAPEGTVVQAYDTSIKYTYAETTVAADGTWKFEDNVLPAESSDLTIVVPGFNADITVTDADGVETTTSYYFSSDDASSKSEYVDDTTAGVLKLDPGTISNADIVLNAQIAKPMVIATNVGSATSPLEPTDALTFTFDTAMDSVTATDNDSGDDLIVSLDDTKKIATVTSPDGVFGSDFEIELAVKVNGEAIALVEATFDVFFDLFSLDTVDVVDSVPTTARAVPIYDTQFLALTFNKEIDTADIAAGSVDCTTYIDGSTVYIPFIEIAQDTGILTGTVTSVDGFTSDNADWNLNAYTAEQAYVITESNLAETTESIGAGADDTLAFGIAPDENITFTFDKDFPEAVAAVEAADAVYDDDGNVVTEAVEAVEAIAAPTVEVELYEAVGTFNINTTMLGATGTVSDNTVTIDPTNDLDTSKTYKVAFTVYYDGNAIYTTANANFTAIDDGTSVTNPYIDIDVTAPELRTVRTAVSTEGVTNVTQDADVITLTYDSAITGYTAYMTTNGISQAGTSADIESGAFVAKATVSGTTMTFDVDTLAPATYYVYAYDANEDALGSVTSFTVDDDDVAPTASTFTLSAPTNATTGVDAVLNFDIPLFITENRNESYQLQKQYKLVDGTSDWTDCGVASISIQDKIDGTTTTTLTETGIGADDDKYSTTITYRVIATVNNQEYVSNTKAVTKE